MKRIALAALAAASALTAAASHAGTAALPPPPPTASRPVEEVVHGVPLVDDYRWLEGSADPKSPGATTPEVAAWTEAQNAYTRSVLDRLPGRKELEAKLRPLMEVGSVGLPRMRGDRYVYSKREGDENHIGSLG